MQKNPRLNSHPARARASHFCFPLLRHSRFVLPLLLAALASGAHAAPEEGIVTDRPDFVESSNVVGSGRFQIETSVAMERMKDKGSKERTLSTPSLLRFGTSDTIELRVETDGRQVYRNDNAALGTSETQRGYADTSLGVKWHALDAEGSGPSVGVLVHADLASGSGAFRGKGVRPSLRVAGEWELPGEMSLGIMPGISYEKNDAGERYTSGIFGIVLGKAWTGQFRSFVEISAPHIASSRNGGTVMTFDVGAAYLLSERCQIDTALSRGLNKRTADLSWTVGLSFKL